MTSEAMEKILTDVFRDRLGYCPVADLSVAEKKARADA